MIEFQNVSKKYGDTHALKDVSFQIKDGQIFGLIGHNGAGKSTTIKILVSIINQTEGNLVIDGQQLDEHRNEIKQRIGYVADTPDIFLRLKAIEYWELMEQLMKCRMNNIKLDLHIIPSYSILIIMPMN